MPEQRSEPREPKASASDTLSVEVGIEELEHGRVRVELAGDGRLVVSKTFEGREQRFEGKVEPPRAHALVDRAAELKGFAAREEEQYRPVPDEARYRLEVWREDRPYVELDLWDGELERNEPARVVIEELRTEVERASDGEAVL